MAIEFTRSETRQRAIRADGGSPADVADALIAELTSGQPGPASGATAGRG